MSADLRDIVTRETRKRERECEKCVPPKRTHKVAVFYGFKNRILYYNNFVFLNMNTAFASSFCRRHLYLCVYVPAKERETKKE